MQKSKSVSAMLFWQEHKKITLIKVAQLKIYKKTLLSQN